MMHTRTPFPRGLAVALAALALLVATAFPHAQAAPLKVIASNGVKAFVEALLPALEHASGRTLAITYGTSSTLVKDIVGGASFDVVITTTDAMTEMAKAGTIADGTRVVIGHSSVGLGVRQGAPKPAAQTAADMKRLLLESKGITYAGDGASRPYIDAMLATLGVAEAVKAKTLVEQGSGRAIARVNAGDADLLITLVSEILPAPGLELVGPLPPEFRGAVAFAAGVAARSPNGFAARAFVSSLVSPDATPTLRQKGLER